MNDPRIQLYADILNRYEFCSWKPIDPEAASLKRRLDAIVQERDSIYYIPIIKKVSQRCVKCGKKDFNHKCYFKACEKCDYYHDDTECCCKYACECCVWSTRRQDVMRFVDCLNDEQIKLVTCFQCRGVGHICDGDTNNI